MVDEDGDADDVVVWVGAYALVKGIMDIILAFKLRSAGKHLGKVTPAV